MACAIRYLPTYSSVMYLALELIQALVWWDILLRRETDGRDEVATVCHTPIRTFDFPLAGLFVKLCASHHTIVFRVLANLQLLVEVLEVASQFPPTGISLLERKVLPDFLVEELVDGRI